MAIHTKSMDDQTTCFKPCTYTSARAKWQAPRVTRYGRLRDGVGATGAEDAEDDYKHDEKPNTISRLGQAPTRESIKVRRFSGSTPKVHLPHPAWCLRPWILNRPLGVGCGRGRLGARDQPRDLVRVDASASFLGRNSCVESCLAAPALEQTCLRQRNDD